MAAKLKIPQDVKTLAKQYGANIDVIPGRRADVAVCSPVGFVWNATGGDGHLLCGSTDPKDSTEHAAMWADFAERMSEGVSPCTDAECDTCHPMEETN